MWYWNLLTFHYLNNSFSPTHLAGKVGGDLPVLPQVVLVADQDDAGAAARAVVLELAAVADVLVRDVGRVVACPVRYTAT